MNTSKINLLFFGDFIPSQKNIIDENIKELCRKADFSLVNLETPLSDSTTAILKTGKNFKKSATDLKPIIDVGFDAVTLANNHIRDFGDKGVIDTLKACCNANIKTLGAGKDILEAQQPLRVQIHGIRLSILNYCEHEYNLATLTRAGANPFDIINAFYQIKEESNENDIVIVIYHGGLEYIKYPTPAMVKEFKFMVDAGADAVIAHHSHFYSGMIYYKARPLIFGLGNFYAETSVKNSSQDLNIGLIAELDVNERFEINSKLIPTIQNTAKKTVALLNGEKNDSCSDKSQEIFL